MNSAFDVSAAVGLAYEPTLRCQARASESAEFFWEHHGDTFTVRFSQESLREFARQATLMLDALDAFRIMEDDDEEPGEFTVHNGTDGTMITADELAERLRLRRPPGTSADAPPSASAS